MIVDEFTGRIMPGRRYSDGLHQAIEAKEHVKVRRESKTLATITFQNLFNKFEKKSGMTGTALTEEKEFRDIYGMDVVEIPTNRPVQRVDLNDAVYKTKKEKFEAVIEEIIEAHAKGQPVLVGTITIETSELLSKMLKKRGIQHKVLNAKFHEKEAEIVADAGVHGAVTIATNMDEQREIIYEERRRVLDGESMRDSIYHMITEYVENVVDSCISPDVDYEEWDLTELDVNLHATLPIKIPTIEDVKGMNQKELKHLLKERAVKAYEEKEAEFPEPEHLREIERVILLKVIDAKWMDHIDDMDQLRQGIGLQAYGQRDPLVEYKMMGYDMFGEMTAAIAKDTVRLLFNVRIEQKVEREQVAKVTGTNKDESAVHTPMKREEKKVYPNDPCPCGSGKKYKQCCGRKA